MSATWRQQPARGLMVRGLRPRQFMASAGWDPGTRLAVHVQHLRAAIVSERTAEMSMRRTAGR